MTTVLAVGVAVVDFVFQVDEMPDRPEKYRALNSSVVGGGCAASAAVAVARLGGKAVLASRLGEDRIGDIIRSDLEADGVDCRFVRSFGNVRSSYASVLIDGHGERQIVSYRDPALPEDAEWLADEIGKGFDVALADTRWSSGARTVLSAARDQSKPGVVDAEAPIAGSIDALNAASHIAFSAQGLRDLSEHDDLVAGLGQAAQMTGAWVCFTDGPNGVTYLDRGEPNTIMPPKVNVIDTLGAGDAWHGAFALALGEGREEVEAIKFANAVASLKCTRFGGRAGIPTRSEAEEFLSRSGSRDSLQQQDFPS